jgi:hypothetical protein
MQGGFAMGIKKACFDLKKSLEDYKVMLERITMAAHGNDDTTFAWQQKGRDSC